MYGIGAVDNNPIGGGSQYAYNMGWDTPEKAIDGGAQWVSDYYINNEQYHQNTLYKIRWNPASPGVHQYATDVSWAVSQTINMKKMYDTVPNATLTFDIPVYKQ
jgi:type VI secretion system secreted protein VgrG